MSNIRTFSCFRRRPHVVDLLTPFVYGVTDYAIQWAQNFDGSFSTIINSTNIGFYDSNIPRGKTELQNTQGFVRITFDPSTYGIDDTKSFWLALIETPPGGTGTTFDVSNGSPTVTASVSQTGILTSGQTISFASQATVQYTLLNVSGTTLTLTANYTGTSNASTSIAGLYSAPTLLLPDTALHGQGIVTIHGAAPAATSSAASLQLDLPFVMQNYQIHNEDATNALYVATEQGGPEQECPGGTAAIFPQYQTVWGAQSSLWVRGSGGAVDFSATFTLAFPR
jgi:hypothetical protein